MLTRIRRDNQHGKNFDALAFELKHALDYKQSQKIPKIFEPQYQIDSDKDEFGELCRVWDGKTIIGVFYQSPTQKYWVTRPYYKGKVYIVNYDMYHQNFETSEDAISHIKALYES